MSSPPGRWSAATVPAGVAAQHPATAEVALAVLGDGGTAADAAVAAMLAACVGETTMTGLGGGGHAICWDAGAGAASLLDFFVAVPGLGGSADLGGSLQVDVVFEDEAVPYWIGAGSVGVPGVAAGLGAIAERFGRMPWAELCGPALDLARHGVPVPPTHAVVMQMLAPVLTLNEGAPIFAPHGRLLRAGDRLDQPGLATTLELLAEEGPGTFTRGTVGDLLLELMREHGGAIGRTDLDAYEPRWLDPQEVVFAGIRVLGRRDLAGMLGALERLPAEGLDDPGTRSVALVEVLAGTDARGDTTNVTVVDGGGNACVVTTSLGLGSGNYLPGLDVHLNSMLGEVDLRRGELVPGERMGSMMAPTVAVDGGGLVAAAGAAGGSRIRSAMVQALSGVLAEGLAPGAAVERPRLHPVGTVVHAEPDYDESALAAVRSAGYEVRRWTTRHHYFGGVGVVGRGGAAGDSRRDGVGLLLRS